MKFIKHSSPIVQLSRRTFSTNERFSNTNGIPTAADILYRNPRAISNRLKLYHLFRLKSQAELDHEDLVAMRKPWSLNMDAPHVRVTRKHLDNPPGIEAQFVPEAGAIAVSFCPEKLNLSKEQHEVLLKIVGDRYQVDGKLVKFEVKDFPFKELNERRALEIVSDLIAYDGKNERFDDVPLTLPKSRRKAELAFPKEWLNRPVEASS